MIRYHYFFCFQLIFRKVSDVRKERELAEKRKNDPVLNQTQDHLVRKLFSKFKKSGPDGVGGPLPSLSQSEKGECDGSVVASTPVESSNNNNNTKVERPTSFVDLPHTTTDESPLRSVVGYMQSLHD